MYNSIKANKNTIAIFIRYGVWHNNGEVPTTQELVPFICKTLMDKTRNLKKF